MRGVQLAVADVVGYRTGKQMRILQDNAQAAAQIGLFDLVDIDDVVADFAVGKIVKAIDEVGNGCFARACGTHKGDLLPRPCEQAHVVQHELFGHIAEIHVVEHHPALERLIGGGVLGLVVMLPRPDAGAPRAFGERAVRPRFGVHQLHIARVGFGRFVHHCKYTLRAGQRHNDGIELLRDLRNRLIKAFVELQKRGKPAQRKAADAKDGKQRARNGRERIADVAEVAHHGHQDIRKAVGVVGAVEQLVVQRVKARGVFRFAAKHLYHLLALHHLFNVAVHRAQAALLRHKVRARNRRQLFGYRQHHRHHRCRQRRERHVQHEH